MFVLKSKAEWIVAVALAILMAATRIHHFGIGTIAPDASTGVFFLAGLMLGSPWWAAAFLLEAVVLDGIAIGFLNVADACISSGYALLAPAYAALWYAGRALRKTESLDLAVVARLLIFATAGTAVFFAVSNLGYFLGSEFKQLGITEYVARVSPYFPIYLAITLFYSAFGVSSLYALRQLGALQATGAR